MRMKRLCERYGMRATRNNRAASHENGAIEARQGSIKHFIEQALLLRANRCFDTLADYRQFIAEVNARLRTQCATPHSAGQSVPYSREAIPGTRSSNNPFAAGRLGLTWLSPPSCPAERPRLQSVPLRHTPHDRP